MDVNGVEPAALRWIISQIGSRERYACPVSLHREGKLRLFYTDAWCPRGRSLLARCPGPVRGLSQRYHPELPRQKVSAFTLATLADELRHKAFARGRTRADMFHRFESFGAWFASRVARHMRSLPLDPKVDVHFAYDTAALESVLHARDRGIFCIVDQMDPGRVHEQTVREENDRWLGWEAAHGEGGAIPDSYFARLAREWAAADLIVVNSEYARRSIHQQGIPREKIAVVPLAYEPAVTAPLPPRGPSSRDQPLRVLFLGQVALAKGIAYLLEAARLLLDANVAFTVVGSIRISQTARNSAPKNVQFTGPILHQDTPGFYRRADVFVLPTVSDGFAITQLEAMSHGLPVIATPNCGDVVTEGQDGLIVPIRDPHRLAAAISSLEADRQLVCRMSANALDKSRQFTLHRFAATLTDAVLRMKAGSTSAPAIPPRIA